MLFIQIRSSFIVAVRWKEVKTNWEIAEKAIAECVPFSSLMIFCLSEFRSVHTVARSLETDGLVWMDGGCKFSELESRVSAWLWIRVSGTDASLEIRDCFQEERERHAGIWCSWTWLWSRTMPTPPQSLMIFIFMNDLQMTKQSFLENFSCLQFPLPG